MRNSICRIVLLASTGLLSAIGAWAQQNSAPPKQGPVSTDLAFTYSAERGEQAPGNCGCFWLQGVGVDAGFTFWKGLAIAAGFNSGKASNIAPGVDLSKVEFAAGPRYTYTAWTGRERRPAVVCKSSARGYLAAPISTTAPSLLPADSLQVLIVRPGGRWRHESFLLEELGRAPA